MTATALLVALLSAPPALAELDGDQYSSADWRISMTAPRNWRLSEQSSYPNILLWMVHHSPDAKMLLGAERVSGKIDAQEYAARTARKLTGLGFEVRPPQFHAVTGAYLLDFDNGEVFLRQAVMVSSGVGYSLTLATRDSRARSQLLRAFDRALRSIERYRPPPASAGGGKESP